MIALDTNIWLYCHDSKDPLKQATAQQLVGAARPLALPWQVGCEFVAASRKLSVTGFTEAQAWTSLKQMQLLADVVILPEAEHWSDAQSLQQKHSLSFWDALLVTACLRGNVNALYTEDMGAPRSIESLALVNPFTTAQIP